MNLPHGILLSPRDSLPSLSPSISAPLLLAPSPHPLTPPQVCIPWARLGSESVTVEIRDVLLLAGPVDPSMWDPEDLRTKNLEAKRAMLEKVSGGGGG